jgi:tetratricopeptide (TPR) repeat protein
MSKHPYFFAAMLVLASPVLAIEPEQRFLQGNQYYEAKVYDSAVTAYEAVLADGYESAPVYFNLGNAYFRNGELGPAVLNYLRAQRLEPADPDIAANLDFAKRFTSVQMEGVKLNPISSLLESLVAPYRLNTLAWVASACFILTIGLLILRFGFGFGNGLTRVGIALALLLLFSASLLTTVKYNRDYLTRRAVIVADECIVRTGPTKNSEKELDAAPGLIVEILSESGDFYNVLFENKRRGWVRKDLIAVV